MNLNEIQTRLEEISNNGDSELQEMALKSFAENLGVAYTNLADELMSRMKCSLYMYGEVAEYFGFIGEEDMHSDQEEVRQALDLPRFSKLNDHFFDYAEHYGGGFYEDGITAIDLEAWKERLKAEQEN